MFNEDTTGVKLTKPSKPGYRIDLQYYSKALDWLMDYILERYGHKVTSIVHDPELDMWRFYEDGQQITSVEQDLLERTALALEKLDWKFEDLLEETLSEEAILRWIEEKERG